MTYHGPRRRSRWSNNLAPTAVERTTGIGQAARTDGVLTSSSTGRFTAGPADYADRAMNAIIDLVVDPPESPPTRKHRATRAHPGSVRHSIRHTDSIRNLVTAMRKLGCSVVTRDTAWFHGIATLLRGQAINIDRLIYSRFFNIWYFNG
jgi:hypothetical protein